MIGEDHRLTPMLHLYPRPLPRAELGKQLTLGVEPIGVGIAGQAESMSAFGNKISAHPDLFVTGIEWRPRSRFFRLRCFEARLLSRGRNGPFRRCRFSPGGFFSSHFWRWRIADVH